MKNNNKRGTPVPATGLAPPAQLFPLDTNSYDEGDTSWDSYDFPETTRDELSVMGAQSAGQETIQDSSFVANQQAQDDGISIVRHIASFLTLSDAASVASMDRILHQQQQAQHDASPADYHHSSTGEWAVGMEWSISMASMDHGMSWNSLHTPPTPGLMALSPSEGSLNDLLQTRDWTVEEQPSLISRRLQKRHKQWVQQKLTAAVFAHPSSIRSFCLEAHQAAKKIHEERRERQEQLELLEKSGDAVDPETLREPPEGQYVVSSSSDLNLTQLRRVHGGRKDKREQLLQFLVSTLLHNVPLSVMFDLAEAIIDTGLDTSFAVFQLSLSSVNAVVSGLIHAIHKVWDLITNFNPFALLDAIISMQFSAVEKTSEALASGFQSVATGVGSASNMALQRLSRGGTTGMKNAASSSSLLSEKMGLRRPRSSQNSILNRKLLKKLSTINDAAQVVAYSEMEEEGLTRHAKRRVQKMMHYDVNLRPFIATVVDPPRAAPHKEDPFGNVDFPSHQGTTMARERATLEGNSGEAHQVSPQSSSSSTPLESPFMCTPKSFPPTPASRSLVLARGTRFADDVVFLARDKMRVECNLESENERTRAMAKALQEGKRLAVFNAADVANGIALSCGQHVATKIGNPLYCSARSMCPVLRNCYVYFEMTALCPPPLPDVPGSTGTTLSIGLSTLEMPLNTLVGAWKSSVGLCSTGQIMSAGQWCSPGDNLSAYGNNATVGCLVRLDDSSPFETWDGVMVTASVTFNVNGVVLSSPASIAPLATGLLPDPSANNGNQGGVQEDTRQPQHPRGTTSATLQLLVPMEEELFPTLTLHSHATQVMCRFSAEDVTAASTAIIGAPEGATVYAVDGSVLFHGRYSP